MPFKTIIEPFKIKVVEPILKSTPKQRETWLKAAHYNPFLLKSEQVMIDFLTDSGTSAMSANQWAGIQNGDESYAGSKSWERMERVIQKLTGHPYILPTHQGRAAERILYGTLGGKNKIFISNTHFDTTRANIEFTGAQAVDIPIKESLDTGKVHPFKGNMDTFKLEEILKKHKKENIGGVILTVTNNSGGGQPVSFDNAKKVSQLCKKFGVFFFLDACRIAENAYFIKNKERGFEKSTYFEIASSMCKLADGIVMSAKKDALVNMGGFLTLKNAALARQCKNLLIITEGFTTYGGLSGRDMEAIATGLNEVFDPSYLEYRIKSTAYLGNNLVKMGIPVMVPIGGHAVYVDAKKLYPQIPVSKYPGQALVCDLYLAGGIRSVEIGSVMFGKYGKNKKLLPAPMELVRLAIPRRVYTQSHIEYVLEVFELVKNMAGKSKGLNIVFEEPFLRHFTAKFTPLN